MNLINKFNTFRADKSRADCSFFPHNNQTYNIYNEADKNKLVKQFGKHFYLLSLTNNIYNKSAIRKARNLGVLAFGKWKNFIDISVLINNKSKADIIKLAKEYKQISVIEFLNDKAQEIQINKLSNGL